MKSDNRVALYVDVSASLRSMTLGAALLIPIALLDKGPLAGFALGLWTGQVLILIWALGRQMEDKLEQLKEEFND